MKKFVLGIACLMALMATCQLAFAHARLVSSIPRADSTTHGPAIRIALKFDSRVDAARSLLELVMPGGKIESLKTVGRSDSSLGARADLAPGKYTIDWQALSIDGHITRGAIPFTVR